MHKQGQGMLNELSKTCQMGKKRNRDMAKGLRGEKFVKSQIVMEKVKE